MKKSWVWINAGLFTIFIGFVGLWLWEGASPEADSLSKNEAQNLIETRYKGKVTQINLDGKQYVAEMIRNDSLYQIKLDSKRGEVVSIDQIGKNNPQPDLPPADVGEKPELPDTNADESDPIITQEDAVHIALGQVSGNLDKVELETEDTFSYYLVEIETADKREAVIQIHAISGEVLSVSWDD